MSIFSSQLAHEILAFTGWSAAFIGLGWMTAGPRTRVPVGHCSACRYDLRGHAPPGVCPECGTAFTADAFVETHVRPRFDHTRVLIVWSMAMLTLLADRLIIPWALQVEGAVWCLRHGYEWSTAWTVLSRGSLVLNLTDRYGFELLLILAIELYTASTGLYRRWGFVTAYTISVAFFTIGSVIEQTLRSGVGNYPDGLILVLVWGLSVIVGMTLGVLVSRRGRAAAPHPSSTSPS